jgi:hypothetical protein
VVVPYEFRCYRYTSAAPAPDSSHSAAQSFALQRRLSDSANPYAQPPSMPLPGMQYPAEHYIGVREPARCLLAPFEADGESKAQYNQLGPHVQAPTLPPPHMTASISQPRLSQNTPHFYTTDPPPVGQGLVAPAWPTIKSAPILKQEVASAATQAAAQKRRTSNAPYICPIEGCGATFTRDFNLKSMSAALWFYHFSDRHIFRSPQFALWNASARVQVLYPLVQSTARL